MMMAKAKTIPISTHLGVIFRMVFSLSELKRFETVQTHIGKHGFADKFGNDGKHSI